jgi:hypothetical protein
LFIANPFKGEEGRREAYFDKDKCFLVYEFRDRVQGFKNWNFSEKRKHIKAYHEVIIIKVNIYGFMNEIRRMFNKKRGFSNECLKIVGRKMSKDMSEGSYGAYYRSD